MKPLLLSEFADSISYVKMDTDPSYFVSSPCAIQTDEGYIFRGEMFHFSKEGKFLCQVGKSGRGPGEYISPTAVGVDPKNKIVYVRGYGTTHSLLKYSLTDGKYIGTLTKDFVNTTMMIKGMDDALVMAYFPQDKRLTDVKQDIILYNTVLDSVMDSRTFDYHITVGEMGNNHHDFTNRTIMTSYHDKIYYKTTYTDTLYSITKEKITPYLIVDLGKYALPVDFIYGSETYENIIKIQSILIAGDSLFMQCTYYSSYGFNNSTVARYDFMYICDLDGQNGSYYEPMFINDLDNGPNYYIPTRGDVSIIDVGEVDGEMKDYYLPNNKMEKKMKDKDRFKRLYKASNPVEDNPIVRTIHWKE